MTPEARIISVALARASRNLYNAQREARIKHTCPDCGEPIKRFHKFSITPAGRKHKNCTHPESKK